MTIFFLLITLQSSETLQRYSKQQYYFNGMGGALRYRWSASITIILQFFTSFQRLKLLKGLSIGGEWGFMGNVSAFQKTKG